MDSILSSLPAPLLDLVEDELSNNERASDEDMRHYFIECGLSEREARRALIYRDRYLSNIYRVGYTPIRKGHEALRRNPSTGAFEPE